MMQQQDIFAPDAVLGRYVAHHPSNRQRLLLRGGILYSVPILFLQFFFFELDDLVASIVLIGAFASLGLAILWYILHNWNREVILYEQGFTYREGSTTFALRYEEIVVLKQRAERFAILGIFKRSIFEFTLYTAKDERLFLNAVYQDIALLGDRLEQRIAQARLPIVKALVARGERIDFGALIVTQSGAETDEAVILWQDYTGYRIENRALCLLRDDAVALQVPLSGLDNLFLCVMLLNDFGTSKNA